jgi:sigma-B regulation protein RsbU (phosphoserine phosphatase)
VNGTVVGILPETTFDQNILDLTSGDLLAAFTDGITESENERGEQFGDERLIDLLKANRNKPLDEILEIVTASVRDWAYDADNQDDTTMLLARRV